MGRQWTVAVVGATGLVGQEMISLLEERRFPVKTLRPLASERSRGEKVVFHDDEVTVEVLGPDSFKGVDIALFSAGGALSREYAPIAAAAGAVVIDNTSAFRMDADVPLVVPEVNPEALAGFAKRRIIANPNCSTIQMVVALKPLHDAATISRIMVTTYQSVSGAGRMAIDELADQSRFLLGGVDDVEAKVFPHRIAFNCIPQIGSFLENGYTEEEMKMINETKKILGDPSLAVSATTVRVPVFSSHSESVHIETQSKLTAAQAREILKKAPGVEVVDIPADGEYPMPLDSVQRDEVFVGRIREDLASPNGLVMWVVADNLRKGAALNAVQIAEILVEKYL